MQTKAKKIRPLNDESFIKRLNKMRDLVCEYADGVENRHVYISEGNSKTGKLVPSVSLVPVMCCPNCASCSKLCYDVRTDCMFPGVQRTRANNTAIWKADPDRYFREISEAIKKNGFRFFRWHIGGDIVNERYFQGMCEVAASHPDTKFLAFTKNFKVVNEHAEDIPQNLQILFSDWVGQDTPNPHNFPTSNPLFADGSTTAKCGAYFCPGSCTNCALTETGCWTLKKGEQVVFPAH